MHCHLVALKCKCFYDDSFLSLSCPLSLSAFNMLRSQVCIRAPCRAAQKRTKKLLPTVKEQTFPTETVECRSMQKRQRSEGAATGTTWFVAMAQNQVPVRKCLLCSAVSCICKRTGGRQRGGSRHYGFPLSIKAALYVPVKHSECMVCLWVNSSAQSCPLFSSSPHHTPGPAELKGAMRWHRREERKADGCSIRAALFIWAGVRVSTCPTTAGCSWFHCFSNIPPRLLSGMRL